MYTYSDNNQLLKHRSPSYHYIMLFRHLVGRLVQNIMCVRIISQGNVDTYAIIFPIQYSFVYVYKSFKNIANAKMKIENYSRKKNNNKHFRRNNFGTCTLRVLRYYTMYIIMKNNKSQ